MAGEENGASVSRRAVLAGAASVAAGFAVGGAGVALAGEGGLFRPPGGQDEGRLLGACIRCDRCRQACPTGAVGIAMVEEGLLNVRTPVMRFRQGFCDMCEGEFRCARACPTGAFLPFDEESDHIGIAVIDTDECLTFAASAHCDAQCVDACAWEALWLDESGRLRLDEGKCNGCGACEYVCVSDSYGRYSDSGKRGINVEPWQGVAR